MGSDSDPETSVTLLGRLALHPANEAAWSDFVDRYGGRIYGWCRKWKLQEADAQDVTQNVLLKLVDKMKDFKYDPSRSFRAWLKTVALHTWQDFVRARQHHPQGSGDSYIGELLGQVAASEDLVKHLEDEFDREVLEQATRQVRLLVAPRTWEAFRLTALEGLSGAEVAKRVGLQVGQVFVARRRVHKLLQQHVQRLEHRQGYDRRTASGNGKPPFDK